MNPEDLHSKSHFYTVVNCTFSLSQKFFQVYTNTNTHTRTFEVLMKVVRIKTYTIPKILLNSQEERSMVLSEKSLILTFSQKTGVFIH